MARRRRTPVSGHPLTVPATIALTFAGTALFVVVTRRLGWWDVGRGEAMWAVAFVAPVVFLYFFYDPITSALDRWVTCRDDHA